MFTIYSLYVYHKFNVTTTNGAAWSIEFQTNGGYFDTRKKTSETRSDRPLPQHWLLFVEHNRCET